MKPVVAPLVTLLAFAALFATSPAQAEPAETAPASQSVPAAPEERQSAVQVHLDASAGISTGGAVLGALGLVRFGRVEVGGTYGTSGLFSTRTGGGVAVGIGGHRPGGGGFDVLLDLGVNEHHVMGSGGLLSSDPGASASIPYGGLRAGVDWAFGNASAVAHPTLGVWLFARLDLSERTASYAYQDSGFFSDRSEPRTGSAHLGGGGEVGITLAGGIDLLP
ncbi:MAG TPA: hypothetical protein VLT33_45095 [Labilithrix sp.]|nr:hypothetical protein [Labilithrix sp.]